MVRRHSRHSVTRTTNPLRVAVGNLYSALGTRHVRHVMSAKGATYHRRRRQDALGRLTPIEFETCYKPLTRPDHHPPHESTKVGADPYGRPNARTLACRK